VIRIYRFVIKKTYLKLLLNLQFGEQKIKECSNKMGMNYAHLTTVFRELSKEGVINKVRRENAFDVSLTKKGKKICECLAALKKAIEETPKEDKEETEDGPTTTTD